MPEEEDTDIGVEHSSYDSPYAELSLRAQFAKQSRFTIEIASAEKRCLAMTLRKVSYESDGTFEAKAITPFKTRLGYALRKMRFKKPDRKFNQYARTWLIGVDEILGWAAAYGIEIPDPLLHIGKIGKIGKIGYVPTGADVLEEAVEYEEGYV